MRKGKFVPQTATMARLHEAIEANDDPRLDQLLRGGEQVEADPNIVPASLAGIQVNRGNSKDGPPHLVIVARAGTGKTTTLVEGLKLVRGMPSTLTPSPQQKAVWDAMSLSVGQARSVCFVAFNKSIAGELAQRVPPGCDAKTMHSMGCQAVNKAYGRLEVNEYKTQDLVAKILCRDGKELRKEQPVLLTATAKLVSLCKSNLVPIDEPADDAEREYTWGMLDELAERYDVELEDEPEGEEHGHSYRAEVYGLVPKILARCRDPRQDGCIDFDDMVWLPVVCNLPVFRFDLLLVDECQDLTPCQQALAYRAGRRLVFCGDDRQAIYGFAGADSDSIPNLIRHLQSQPRGCTVLPLTVTRRCGKAIVDEARKIVPDFEAHESNGAGQVRQMKYTEGQSIGAFNGSYHAHVQSGDMVICRVNAPLVSQCFRFIRAGRKAYIQGRDVGKGLISLVERLHAQDVFDLVGRLEAWREAEVAKEQVKKNPSEAKLIGIHDKVACILALTEGCNLVSDVSARINQIFSDGGTGIRLSSIHRAKGLEADNVFFLMPKGAGCPHPSARSAWQMQAEQNLLYVGITRAKHTLTFVK